MRSWLTLLTMHLTLAVAVCPAADAARFEFDATHMGTTWRLVLYAADKTAAKKSAKAAFDRVAELEKVMSDYDPKSELMLLSKANDTKPGEAIPISDDLLDVLGKAAEVSEATNGAFDITVGPLSQLWRTARKTKRLPGNEVLKASLGLVGRELWSIDVKAKTATLKKAKMRLDLGGIGKGYAADAAMAVLKKQGIASALVAASGDITVSAAPPDREYWTVDVPSPFKDRPVRRLGLVNASVSTSGDLYQYAEIDGIRYSHVLDPKTGLGQTGRRTATVVADAGWKADAYTKAALLLPSKDATKLIEARCLGLSSAAKAGEDGEIETAETEGFRKKILE